VCDLETSRIGAPYIYDLSRLRVKFGNLKEGKNEAVPGEPGKMEYIQA